MPFFTLGQQQRASTKAGTLCSGAEWCLAAIQQGLTLRAQQENKTRKQENKKYKKQA
jgi:hypothetical protein